MDAIIKSKGIAVASNKHSDQYQHQHSQHQHQHQQCREASRFDKKECFIHIQSVIYYEL